MLNFSCAKNDTEDWSFLKLINTQLVVGKKCPIKVQSQSVSEAPQSCYALIGNLDLNQWEKENVLSSAEIKHLESYKINEKTNAIPKVIMSQYFEYISRNTYELE